MVKNGIEVLRIQFPTKTFPGTEWPMVLSIWRKGLPYDSSIEDLSCFTPDSAHAEGYEDLRAEILTSFRKTRWDQHIQEYASSRGSDTPVPLTKIEIPDIFALGISKLPDTSTDPVRIYAPDAGERCRGKAIPAAVRTIPAGKNRGGQAGRGRQCKRAGDTAGQPF